jgi:LPS sulfotransferase NodH
MPSIALPATTYIIASTMRTGSYLLCEGLEATGIAGHPREIFCPERRAIYCGEWRLPTGVSFSEFVATAVRTGMTDNGVCGMKIHWHHVEPLAREAGAAGKTGEVLHQLFPNALYIHLRRRDRRAQAISWFRAKVTNEWWRIADVVDPELTGKKPHLDTAELRFLEMDLERQDRAWGEFFAAQPHRVMTMDYETLAADYRGEVSRALAFLGQDQHRAEEIPSPRLVCQSDEMTREWHRAMDAEFPAESTSVK